MHKLRTKKNPYVSKTLALVLRYLACEYAARLYAGYDFWIVECTTGTSTSGTFHPALRLPLRHCVASTQHGVSICSLRGGGVVGDHAVLMMVDDVIIIEHRSTTSLRNRCCRRCSVLCSIGNGLYDMQGGARAFYRALVPTARLLALRPASTYCVADIVSRHLQCSTHCSHRHCACLLGCGKHFAIAAANGRLRNA